MSANSSDNHSSPLETQDSLSITITDEDCSHFRRLDHLLAARCGSMSRSLIKKLFEQGEITLTEGPSGKKLALSRMPAPGSLLWVNVPPPIPANAQPEDIPLQILFEDEHLLFLNKEAGMVTHPGAGNHNGTLVNALLHHCQDLSGIGGVKRPGIVHRLDKGTSGVMVVAKTQKCHEELVLLFSQHKLERTYMALLAGVPHPLPGRIESMIGRNPGNRLKMMADPPRGAVHARRAVTHYKIISTYPELNWSLVEFKLETGRTHQIRVHASSLLKTPLLMDPLYGKPAEQLNHIKDDSLREYLSPYPYPLLHARSLALVHPITGQEMRFEVDPPPFFFRLLTMLGKGRP